MPPTDPLPPIDDPLDNSTVHPDAYHGAVLLSDQIQFYIEKLAPPLVHNPHKKKIGPDELKDCLDAASYKLRLGDEANVGGRWKPIDESHPLVIPAHQVAVVKTYESVNLPRFLIARWNLRVKWVYEGLLWVGGPQVDPGWQGKLYCPIYNLAEREVVIQYKERFFTMDFSRTTPFSKEPTTTGNKPIPHKPGARAKTLQGHDVHRIRSAPFEALRQLSTLDTRVSSFSTFTFLVLAVLIAAIGVVAAFGGARVAGASGTAGGDSGLLVLTILALVFGFSGLVVGVIAIALKREPTPKWRPLPAFIAFLASIVMSGGSVLVTLTAASVTPDWLSRSENIILAGRHCTDNRWPLHFGRPVVQIDKDNEADGVTFRRRQ